MNIHHLEIFFYVAKFSSISKAASYLYISQPAVSAQIKKLEQTYQTKLVQKSGRGIKLTPIGEQVYGMISEFFNHTLSEVEHLLEDTPAIQLCGNYLMTQFILPDILLNQVNSKKSNNILIKSMSSHEALANLQKDNCELIFISTISEIPIPADLSATKLFDDKIVLMSRSKNISDISSIIISKSKKDVLSLMCHQLPQISTIPVITVDATQDAIANIRVNPKSATFVSSRFIDYFQEGIHYIETDIISSFYAVYKKMSRNQGLIDQIIKAVID